MNETSLKQSFRHCTEITKQRAKNFYYAFLTLPRPARWGIYAIYAYCRELDDIADGEGASDEKHRAIQSVTMHLKDSLEGSFASPIFPAVAATVKRYGIPVQHLLEVAAGVEQDLVVHRYQTFAGLKEYCYLVASSVGLMCLELFGYRSESMREAARRAAVDMGIAMQLTNVLRDVAEDSSRDRIYLPLDDLKRFGVPETDLLRLRYSPAFKRLMEFQAERAKQYYASAQRLFQYLPRRSRPCPVVLLGVYRRLLAHMEERDFDVLGERVSLRNSERAATALGLWARGLLWKPPA